MAGAGRPGPDCGIKVLLDQLDDDGATMVRDLFADDETWWTASNPYGLTDLDAARAFDQLVAAADLDLPPVHRQTVGTHRRGACRCYGDDL